MRTGRTAGAGAGVASAVTCGLVLAIALGACAQQATRRSGPAQPSAAARSTTPAPGQAGQPGGTVVPPATRPPVRTVVVTPRNMALPVLLAVGDHLEVVLPGSVAAPWALSSYPAGVLRLLVRDPGHGRWLFAAQATGRGVVQFGNPDPCRPPRMCPVSGEPTDGVAGRFPGGGMRFVIVVR